MDTVITTLLDQIQSRVIAAIQTFVPAFDPLWIWYFWLAVAFVVIVVVAYFLPFQWIRATLGGLFLLAVAFVAGGRQMRKEDQAELDKERAKNKPKPKSAKPPNTGF